MLYFAAAEDNRQRRGATCERKPAVLQGTWARTKGNLSAFIVLRGKLHLIGIKLIARSLRRNL